MTLKWLSHIGPENPLLLGKIGQNQGLFSPRYYGILRQLWNFSKQNIAESIVRYIFPLLNDDFLSI
jgi:hypothetical protein